MLTEYKPTAPDQFLGPARQVAVALSRIIDAASMRKSPVKLLLNGPPGTGKTTLAEFAVAQLQSTKWSTRKYNGTGVNIDVVNELRHTLHLRDLFGNYRVIHIDEADKIPHIAQVAFLSLLDDLPPEAAVICTSNCSLDQFEQRFQSRFQTFTVNGPAADEIRAFLIQRGVAPVPAARIAEFACGNVRAALLDAATTLAMAA